MKRIEIRHIRQIVVQIAVLSAIVTEVRGQMPDEFVDVRSVIPDIALDIRYATGHNFIGRPIPGYGAAKRLLSRAAAEALANVQNRLADSGLWLQVYDCYRPQSAVDYFVKWDAILTTK